MSKVEEQQKEQLRKLKQALREGVVDYECPECGMTLRGEPDARELWCEQCQDHVEVKPVI